jgi:hypothetical protein
MVCFERKNRLVSLGKPVLLPTGRLGKRIYKANLKEEIYVDCLGKLCCKHGEWMYTILGNIKARKAATEDGSNEPKTPPLAFTGSVCKSPCDCTNINGLRREYLIDSTDLPKPPLLRSELFEMLGSQGAREVTVRGHRQRLAASFPTEDGGTSEIWLDKRGKSRCQCGFSIDWIRNRHYELRHGAKHQVPLDTLCHCPATLLGRVGSLLSKHNWRGRVPAPKRYGVGDLVEPPSDGEDECVEKEKIDIGPLPAPVSDETSDSD